MVSVNSRGDTSAPSASPAPAAEQAPRPSGRDPWFDNAKILLVTLVVVGHAWALLPSRPVLDQLYAWLYLWHMPAFVMVTGYLSRRMSWTRAKVWANVRTLAVPYLLFEAAMALFRIRVGGESLDDLWLNPHWPLWYLAAVFVWRMLTPALRAVPAAVVVAVVLSVAAGFWTDDTLEILDLARILGFLPFFVIGLKAGPQHVELIRRTPVRVAGVLVLAVALVAVRYTRDVAGVEWFYYRTSYDALGADGWTAVLTRLGVLAVGFVCAIAFLSVVPTVRTWFTSMGAATMIVYLFHGFPVRGAEYAGFGEWAAVHPWLAVPVIVLGGTAVSLLLAWRPVSKRLETTVDPVGHAEQATAKAVAVAAVATDPVPAKVQAVLEVTDPPPGAADRSDAEPAGRTS